MTRTGAVVEHDVARRAAQTVLDQPGADGVEVVIAGSDSGLTRYAGSQIIQNTVRHEVRAYVRVHVDDRVASATTNQLDADRLRAAAVRALEAARSSRSDPEFPGFPAPDEVGRPEPVMRWNEETASASPQQRADVVRELLDASDGIPISGLYETSAHSFGVFSSTGVDCHDAYTRCVVTCLADTGTGTGWAEDASYMCEAVDHRAIVATASMKARRGSNASDANPGAYEVVLEAPAVATLLDYLSYSGFGAKQALEGESFLSSLRGKKVASDGITVADDARHPQSIGIGFDFEGVPRKRVDVIEKGVAIDPVTDLRTARKMGVEPSGHYSGSSEFGPYASNVLLEPGDRSIEDLISGVDHGLLVTRFHYVNILDRPRTLLTGMTRDGTFRIRRGEIAEPVHNLRFTNSVLEALTAASGIGRDLHRFAPESGSFGSTVCPALCVGEFQFSSVTSH